MEYKLIPYPNQEGEWIIVSNEEPKEKQWLFTKDDNTFLYCDEINQVTGIARNGTGITFGLDGNRPVIAFTKIPSFIGKSIPLIRKERIIKFIENIDEEQSVELAYKTLREYEFTGDDQFRAMITIWLDGYNKHAEIHPFTLEDMKKAIWYGYNQPVPNLTIGNLNDKDYILKNSKEFIQSLQQPKKKYIVELEMEQGYEGMNGFIANNSAISEDKILFKPKVDTEGYLNILSIK